MGRCLPRWVLSKAERADVHLAGCFSRIERANVYPGGCFSRVEKADTVYTISGWVLFKERRGRYVPWEVLVTGRKSRCLPE